MRAAALAVVLAGALAAPAAAWEEPRLERPLLGPAEVQWTSVHQSLEWAEDAELDTDASFHPVLRPQFESRMP